MDTMEAELTRLTAMTEQLKDRVDKVVKDGTNRVGDLEFRVCELEEGCDPSSVGQAQPLGGGPGGGGRRPAASGGAASTGGTMAMNEQADFDRAKGCSIKVTFAPLRTSLRPLPKPTRAAP
ncbi:hypothetical protein ACTTAM_01800 [Rhodobacter capsulatus]|uniref:hypothetical protein n=1 Tax=Rhodobacter capsulatus TaxID=1061 RepID=UPI004025B204